MFLEKFLEDQSGSNTGKYAVGCSEMLVPPLCLLSSVVVSSHTGKGLLCCCT